MLNNNLHDTNSFVDEAVTGGNPVATTSGTVVAFGIITNGELEIVVTEPVKPGKLLFSGTSTELGRMISTVLGASGELLERAEDETA